MSTVCVTAPTSLRENDNAYDKYLLLFSTRLRPIRTDRVTATGAVAAASDVRQRSGRGAFGDPRSAGQN